jgi:hypothetical protein
MGFFEPPPSVAGPGRSNHRGGGGQARLVLNLGLEAQPFDRGELVEPFALDEVAGLLDAGVMFHRKPQRRRARLLLMGRGQLQGRHDQPREGIGGREVPGLPRLRVGAGEVEHADGAMALAHRCAQPCPDARRQRQGRNSGQRGSPARSQLATGASSRNASTDGPSPSRTCEPARERRGLPAAAT